MSGQYATSAINKIGQESLERRLACAATDADALGAVQLANILESKNDFSLTQSAFDCLELWGNHPNHIEPIYAAASIFYEGRNIHLGLMASEYAMAMRATPANRNNWPLHKEATGWQLELLYARLLVLTDRVHEAMAHFGSVLVACDEIKRREVSEEVVVASQRLSLCELIE